MLPDWTRKNLPLRHYLACLLCAWVQQSLSDGSIGTWYDWSFSLSNGNLLPTRNYGDYRNKNYFKMISTFRLLFLWKIGGFATSVLFVVIFNIVWEFNMPFKCKFNQTYVNGFLKNIPGHIPKNTASLAFVAILRERNHYQPKMK